MSASGANWLKRESRASIELPEQLLDALDITPGMTIADVGAGIGYFSWRLSKRVGPKGLVYATDIQKRMIALLNYELKKRKIDNVRTILGTASDPNLPRDSIDIALLVDVYHEFKYPETMVSKLRQALRNDGKLVLVEYRGEDPNVPIKLEHKMTVQQVLKEILPMGFRLKTKLDFLPWQHLFIFVKN
jgi:ubiquinone/menaquinone biosynthesis C-methylase UbiE